MTSDDDQELLVQEQRGSHKIRINPIIYFDTFRLAVHVFRIRFRIRTSNKPEDESDVANVKTKSNYKEIGQRLIRKKRVIFILTLVQI